MKKIQQFFIRKINSNRLNDDNYKLKSLTLEEARRNGEVVSIGQSQLIRKLFEITGRRFSQIEVDNLNEEKRRLSKRKSSAQNRKKLQEINNRIDEILYIPELVSIEFSNKTHYKKILDKKGFFIDSCRYVDFMASAGMIRRSSILFVDYSLKEKLDDIFDNGRNLEAEINPSKFDAYKALYSSTTFDVSFPRIAVVKDKLITSVKKVNYSKFQDIHTDPVIIEKEMELEFNAFDGEGIISLELAKRWSKELELDYVASVFGVRAPFLKGMLVSFPIYDFAQEVIGQTEFVDVYGNAVDIEDVDCIISESMFKLWSSYSSTEDYIKHCTENNLHFGICKLNPKKDKDYCTTSYQFLQILNLTDSQIADLTKPTQDWISYISGGSVESTLLYLLGDMEFSKGWFDRLDPITKAIILDNRILNDSYVNENLQKSIAKKKKDACLGRLIFNGNYSAMVADPYAFMSCVFGEIQPLLHDGEHYSSYWNEKHVSQVAAIRSPAVHSSEINVLNFRNDNFAHKWLSHLNGCIVYPANGISMDCAIHGGSDFDFDIVATINSKEIIDGRIVGLPVVYDTKKASKYKITKETEYKISEARLNMLNSNKIGYYTNVSSTLYSLLSEFDQNSVEYQTISNRLLYGRVLQGNAIDAAKGIEVDPFLEFWVKWKNPEKMEGEEKERQLFYNRILAERRPYFMRHLYSGYNANYLKELAIFNNISWTKWLVSFDDLRKREMKTLEQQELIDFYERRSRFLTNDSTMNRICRYMEVKLADIKVQGKEKTKDFDFSILYSLEYKKPSRLNLDKILLLYKEWKSLKRRLNQNKKREDNDYSDIAQINSYINKKAYATISSSAAELADLAIYLCYEQLGKNSKQFAWQCFGREIAENIRNRTNPKSVRVPERNNKGSLNYLWSRFGMYNINVED